MSEPAAATTPAPPRELGFWICSALIVGNTIGIGIFMMPAALAPFGFNGLIGWGIVVFGCLVLARVFARLAQTYPSAEGPYTYIRTTLGRWPAFLSMWMYWVSAWITNAVLAVAVIGYLKIVAPVLDPVPGVALALVLLWFFVGVNLLGVKSGGRVQVLTTLLKLLPMAFVILLGLWLLFANPQIYTRTLPTTPFSLTQSFAAATIALYAMLGFESASIPGSRVKDPGHTIPRATLIGTLVTAVIYILVSAIPLLLIPQADLAQSSAPFVTLLDRVIGEGSGRWLGFFVVVSGLGALNGWTLLVGTLTANMASTGAFPPSLARLNSCGAPAVALILTGLLASGMIAMNYSRSLVDGFKFLSTIVTAANLPLYLCCSLALAVLWKRGERPAGARDLLVLGLLGTAFSIVAFIGMGHEPFLWALVLAAAGLPVAWLARRRT